MTRESGCNKAILGLVHTVQYRRRKWLFSSFLTIIVNIPSLSQRWQTLKKFVAFVNAINQCEWCLKTQAVCTPAVQEHSASGSTQKSSLQLPQADPGVNPLQGWGSVFFHNFPKIHENKEICPQILDRHWFPTTSQDFPCFFKTVKIKHCPICVPHLLTRPLILVYVPLIKQISVNHGC